MEHKKTYPDYSHNSAGSAVNLSNHAHTRENGKEPLRFSINFPLAENRTLPLYRSALAIPQDIPPLSGVPPDGLGLCTV